MQSSLYIGATGMKGLAEGLNVTANNLANVSTIGYKSQNILFSDIMYQTQASMGDWWGAQDNSYVAIGQVGMGLQVEAVRTSYTQGALESSNTMTDLAINGKGFFQVSDGDKVYYTRAGDFRTDSDGVWRTPTGYALNGYPLNADGTKGELSAVQVDTTMTIPAKATSNVTLTLNLDSKQDLCSNEENPFFSLMQLYDGTSSTPISPDAAALAQQMTLYGEDGGAQTVTAYFDSVSVSGTSNLYKEFIITQPVSGEDIQEGSGLLMCGVLEFDSAGNLLNVSAFTPTEEGSKDLSTWTAAALSDSGNPTLNLNGAQVSLNFGVSAQNGYASVPDNAAEIGSDYTKLSSMGEINKSSYPTVAYNSTLANSYSQDGYNEGYLSSLSVGTDGVITGSFSNGQSQDLWEIPICRFTSEDGLYREGGNLFSATEESGQMEMGTPGTENYGTINAYNTETSNVDYSTEMVNLIITQRGFQSNSKVVTVSDQMLQKAMELKRN